MYMYKQLNMLYCQSIVEKNIMFSGIELTNNLSAVFRAIVSSSFCQLRRKLNRAYIIAK